MFIPFLFCFVCFGGRLIENISFENNGFPLNKANLFWSPRFSSLLCVYVRVHDIFSLNIKLDEINLFKKRFKSRKTVLYYIEKISFRFNSIKIIAWI